MTSEEARIGLRVRVREEHRTPHVRGKTGTVTHTWGDPRYLVLDVLLDGRPYTPGCTDRTGARIAQAQPRAVRCVDEVDKSGTRRRTAGG
jgi:hypothetical protein